MEDQVFQDKGKAFNAAKDGQYIIYTHGLGYEIVDNDFYIDKIYYHGPYGVKRYFDVIALKFNGRIVTEGISSSLEP